MSKTDARTKRDLLPRGTLDGTWASPTPLTRIARIEEAKLAFAGLSPLFCVLCGFRPAPAA
jgi:hypothetical protein